ncbi:MAG: radical SAM protein, partial [archaeon]|nr:radical SAM protein [archaeon]
RNILWILEKAGIPLSSHERISTVSDKENFPLIIGGGPVATSNPLPLSKIFDLFFIGDAEPNLELFLNEFNSYKSNEIDFQEFLEKVDLIEGIFVPSFKRKVKRLTLKDLDDSPISAYQLSVQSIIEDSLFENNFFIEVNRGCPFQCKFCISSFHNSPFRNRSYESIQEVIEQWKDNSIVTTISLIGSCVSAHPKFYEICEQVIKNGKRLTIPSIRIEHLTPKILQILEKGNIKTITIAPETGSDRLRFELGKKISNKQIFDVTKQIKNSQ